MDAVRTTITLDADVAKLLKKSMRQRDIGFKQAVNDAIRAGLARPQPVKAAPSGVFWPVYDMGQPLVDLTKANALAGELEDEERIRRMVSGSA
jgi:hypothetical protein